MDTAGKLPVHAIAPRESPAIQVLTALFVLRAATRQSDRGRIAYLGRYAERPQSLRRYPGGSVLVEADKLIDRLLGRCVRFGDQLELALGKVGSQTSILRKRVRQFGDGRIRIHTKSLRLDTDQEVVAFILSQCPCLQIPPHIVLDF